MNILALDTSTEYLSLALLLDGKLHQREILAGQSHSQRILPLLRELLDEAGMELRDMDGIAFGAGPGSFTGLRIGCGVAQGLALGAELPVIGISTLLALAEDAIEADKVIACLDARMGEVYQAVYIKQAHGWQEVIAPGLYKPEAVPAVEGNGWTGVGSGWQSYASALQHGYGEQVAHTVPGAYPRAAAIAALALPAFMEGQGRPADEAAPVYIRNKVALKTSERLAKASAA
ncbi:tRNA (adenosine(37)-N6)-threonylcarbamoyltransferase complex dimerization subunit type 1 TsaB [Methylobacillus gramineus]|uniref:tRNA (adenosine(37)-N6)-threonylcarbamoyltransferase complex dimerization subunit type 1 TsaB n=1 Tax=Methylobacillus gramineus TaxID=755169 RepID=UPI001CFFED1B|nr:tRNA (adenosine(37)-N6)-threonylcarbamoyltransferase complex dimerization subunit type 1 TsaB [Methylobacillus gramineus]MCB5185262.1 tRNA (adenosine(37)-N6)-threonylcarbamoyltransferase complex dimerization subunit type 1 TsaB [Methylobacillus gramineus]